MGGVMVSMLASSAIDRGFESKSGQTKDYQIWSLLLLQKAHSSREKEQ